MCKCKGTPTTLEQAIRNGADGITLTDHQVSLIELHVRDYLAQSFAASILVGDNETCSLLSKLWTKITGRKILGMAA